jgi:hypothetical protein
MLLLGSLQVQEASRPRAAAESCPVETRPFILLAEKKKKKISLFTKYLSMAERSSSEKKE